MIALYLAAFLVVTTITIIASAVEDAATLASWKLECQADTAFRDSLDVEWPEQTRAETGGRGRLGIHFDAALMGCLTEW